MALSGSSSTPIHFHKSNFEVEVGLEMPDRTSTFSVGGNSGASLSCRCQLSQLRFYKELFVGDVALMAKFSDYGVGNESASTPRLIPCLKYPY